MTSRSYLIDEPSTLADRATWEAHLETMRRLHERDPHPDVAAAISRAEDALKSADLAWVEERQGRPARKPVTNA